MSYVTVVTETTRNTNAGGRELLDIDKLWVCRCCVQHSQRESCDRCDHGHNHDAVPLSDIRGGWEAGSIYKHDDDGYDEHRASACEGCGDVYHGERWAIDVFRVHPCPEIPKAFVWVLDLPQLDPDCFAVFADWVKAQPSSRRSDPSWTALENAVHCLEHNLVP